MENISLIKNYSTPIAFFKEDTLPKKILRIVSQYLSLRNTKQLVIYEPPTLNNTPWALESNTTPRSWANTTLIAISYCTLVLPILAFLIKMSLSQYLQISSIPINDLTQHTDNLYNYTSKFYLDGITSLEQQFSRLSYSERIEDPLFRQLFTSLLSSPLLLCPKYRNPILNKLLDLVTPDQTEDSLLYTHKALANLISHPSSSIRSYHLYLFCSFLWEEALPLREPSLLYSILHMYEKTLGHDFKRVMEECLRWKARTTMTASQPSLPCALNQQTNYQRIEIPLSSWIPPFFETDKMPEAIENALWHRIQKLREFASPLPGIIVFKNTKHIPNDYALSLTTKITEANLSWKFEATN